MNDLIIEKLKEYKPKTVEEEQLILKEIAQEIILYAFSRTDFFDHAYFCGGTSLRIVHGLNRFSEDLDFSTNVISHDFSFDDYMPEILKILNEFGLEMSVKQAKDDGYIKARALKEDSEKWKLSFPSNRKMKKIIIKLEIDTNPPLGAISELKRLDFPLLHQIKVAELETLFAGKIHALLSRPFVKGRDWYDFLWYVKKSSGINYEFLKNALFQAGPYKEKKLDVNVSYIKGELKKKIESLNWADVVKDVERFIQGRELETLKLWDQALFLEKVEKL
jgi:predicted nucleotidyltransferase component of viral defense system